MPARPTRLELHRLKYHQAQGNLPLLPWNELSEYDRGLFSSDFFTRCFLDRQVRDPYEIYVEALADWGVMCPHPEHKREGRGCGICGSFVMGGSTLPRAKVAGGRG
jgi:hypothetical protein